jgi:ubiquinone/menaquinone biosynthesis C-methylase UbiE
MQSLQEDNGLDINYMDSHTTDFNFDKLKEELYLKVREIEGRIYDEKTLQKLPDVDENHRHAKEWILRKKSAEKIARYLSLFKNHKILDLGCGNGWLSNYLAEKTNNKIFAVDLNLFELKQGMKAFKNCNLNFIYGDIYSKIFTPGSFNFVIIASAIQYFDDLSKLFLQLSSLLKPKGEIHIIDSPFYFKDEVESARKRSKTYYKEIDHPGMADFYFHHTWNELNEFDYKILGKRRTKIIRLFKKPSKVNPFPWIKITLD